MRIVQFEAANIKRLRAVSITPNGNVVTIAGPNGAGKTSLLDSIAYVFTGAAGIAARPIRTGEETAHIRLDLGDIVVRREFTEGGTRLFVEAQDGARYGSPQRFVDALYGELTFDPLAFSRMAPKEQRETLRKLVPLDVDVDALDRQYERDYILRTEWNRKVKSLAERAKFLEQSVDTAVDPTPIDVSALIDQVATASEHNAQITLARSARARRAEDAEGLYAQSKELFDRAVALRREADVLDQRARAVEQLAFDATKALQAEPELAEPLDVTELRARIDGARVANAERQKQQEARDTHQRVVDELEAATLTVGKLEASMAARQEEKTMAIARAKMPVDGLGFGDGEVLYNGLPFSQASSAEQLRVSFAIAMAANPRLKVVLIRDGSLLDERSLALVAEMAAQHDYQVWIERAEIGAKVGILIEEGVVTAIDGVPVDATSPELVEA